MEEKIITIIIGGSFDKDLKKLFKSSKEEIDKQPKNAFYFDNWEQFSKLLTKKGKLILQTVSINEPIFIYK